MTDAELLHTFVNRTAAERDGAFAELVTRNAAWMYAAALRQLADAHAAEEAVQASFIVLARKAASVRGDRLASWLAGVLRLAAKRLQRDRARQRHHETQVHMDMPPRTEASAADLAAWNEIAPHLDVAVARLKAIDREAVVLRFYRGLTFAEIGIAAGISEEAARKRVARALSALRPMIGRGAAASAMSATALVALLATHTSATAAPPGLAAAATTISLAGGSSAAAAGPAGILAGHVSKVLAGAQIKWIAIAAAALILGAGIGVADVLLIRSRSAPITSVAAPVAPIPSPAPPNIAPPIPSIDTSSTATLADGSTAEIIAIGADTAPGQPETWWSPTGQPIAPPVSARDKSDAPEHKPGKQYVWVAYLCRTNGRDQMGYSVEISGANSDALSYSAQRPDRQFAMVKSVELDTNQSVFGVDVAFTSQTPVELTLRPSGGWKASDAIDQTVRGYGHFAVWNPHEEPSRQNSGRMGAAFTYSVPRNLNFFVSGREADIVFLDSAGKDLYAGYTDSNGSDWLHHIVFDKPLNQISAAVLRLRHYDESIRFRNLPARPTPGKPSVVSITATDPPPSSEEILTAALRDGTTVALLGVSENIDPPARRWWAPDGGALTQPPYANIPNRTGGGKTTIELPFRIDGNDFNGRPWASSANISWSSDGTSSGRAPYRPDAAKPDLIDTVLLRPKAKNEKTATVRLAFPLGDFKPVITLPAAAGESGLATAQVPGIGEMKLSVARDVNGQATVTAQAALPPVWVAVIVSARGKNGRVVPPVSSPWLKDGLPHDFSFTAPLSDVAEFRIQTRDERRWIEFRGVALEPGVATTPTVVVNDPPQP